MVETWRILFVLIGFPFICAGALGSLMYMSILYERGKLDGLIRCLERVFRFTTPLFCKLGIHHFQAYEWAAGYTRNITCSYCPHKRDVKKTHQFLYVDRDVNPYKHWGERDG